MSDLGVVEGAATTVAGLFIRTRNAVEADPATARIGTLSSAGPGTLGGERAFVADF